MATAVLEEQLDENERQQALEALFAAYVKLRGGPDDVSRWAGKAIFPLLKITEQRGDIQ